MYLKLPKAVESASYEDLLFLFQNAENQKNFPDIFKETLERYSIVANKSRTRAGFSWFDLLTLFQHPEAQDNFPDIFEKVLKGAIAEATRRDANPVNLLLFFKNPENQKRVPDIFKKTLENCLEIARRKYRRLYVEGPGPDYLELLPFFQNLENQNNFPDIFREVLERSLEIARKSRRAWVYRSLLSFFENPENQAKYLYIFREALEGVREDIEIYCNYLLSFFSNPENQDMFPDIFKEVLKEVLKKLRGAYVCSGCWPYLLSLFQNPENRRRFPDIFKEVLEEVKRCDDPPHLLKFFQNPENTPRIEEIFVKFSKSLLTISDRNLREKFTDQLTRYLTNNESLSLIILSPIEDLPLLITGQNLGIDPFVIQSWNLSEEERESLLPIFISLAEKGIKFDFPFPYSPREELKRTRKLNEMVIEYFRTLDFILSLPEEFREADLIQNHFRNIKQIIEKYKIEQTTLDISYGFLREILTEIKGLEKRMVEKIKELLKISQDIEDKKIFNFIKECTYFPVILTLAAHYSKIYRDGLTLLGKITSSLIKDPTLEDYFQMRYDLNDPTTREQLNPLLEGKSPEEYPQIVEKWRNPYYTFKILSQEERERIETSEIDWDQVWDHIKSQTYKGKHYEQLFELKEFKNLEEENKNKIREIINSIFTSENKTINFAEIKKMLQEKLSEKKISILTGYFRLLIDIYLRQKTLDDIKSTIKRLNKNIQENWQEFGQLTMWQLDIYNYLTQLIEEREKGRKIIRKQTILLSYFTDHPKTLLEIGKYPISTCQDYESTGYLNKALLGYVLDAHIKALVLREIEIETEEEINEEDLNQAKVNLDEEKDIIKITLTNGKTIKGRISKPIARRIIMLGKKEGKATLLLEPIYSRLGREDETYEKFLDTPLGKIRLELNLEITESGEGVILPQSHNPAGYYRDV
jgi:hypothetical protein